MKGSQVVAIAAGAGLITLIRRAWSQPAPAPGPEPEEGELAMEWSRVPGATVTPPVTCHYAVRFDSTLAVDVVVPLTRYLIRPDGSHYNLASKDVPVPAGGAANFPWDVSFGVGNSGETWTMVAISGDAVLEHTFTVL
jgi:hypothetical protein